MSSTWSDIRSEIRRLLEEPSTSGKWTDAELLRRANMVIRRIVRDTECLKSVSTANTSVSGTREYNKPSGCLKILLVKYGDNKIHGIPREDLDMAVAVGNIGKPWTDDSDTPTHYYETFTTIVLYPNPDDTGTVITIEYLPTPSALAVDADIPFNSVTYLDDMDDLIVNGVAWKCLFEDKDKFYAECKSEFLGGITKLRRQLKDKPDTFYTGDLARQRGTKINSPLVLPY